MCGILLYLSRKNKISSDIFKKALNIQNHRGPDFEKIFYKNYDNLFELKNDTISNFFIGHKRLAVIDLTKSSAQPIYNEKENSVFAFNGEIYNYKEDDKFNNSDTLFLRNVLSKRSNEELLKLNGAWAFVYYLLNEQKIIISRDRYGKKPLYYFINNDDLIISSEIKSIMSILNYRNYEVDNFSLSYFISTKQTPNFNNGRTFYKDIKSFRPGNVYSLDINNFQIKKIYNIRNKLKDLKDYKNTSELLEIFTEIFDSSVELRMNSDVPISILASGGLDSSCLIGSAYKKKDFTLVNCQINSQNNLFKNDRYYASMISNNLNIKLIDVDLNNYTEFEFLSDTLELSKKALIPINFFLATMPTYFISKELKKQGVKVAIDGVGGDEIMGGYANFNKLFNASIVNKKLSNSLKILKIWKNYDENFSKNFIKIIIKGLLYYFKLKKNNQPSEIILNKLIKVGINKKLIEELNYFNKFYFNRGLLDEINDIQYFEINKHQIPYYLYTSDFFNMINSVENRSPFLDYRLQNFVDIKDSFKFRGKLNKFLLRKYLKKTKIPNEVYERTNKLGFNNVVDISVMKNKFVNELIDGSNFIRNLFDNDLNLSNLDIDTKRTLYSIAAVNSSVNLI